MHGRLTTPFYLVFQMFFKSIKWKSSWTTSNPSLKPLVKKLTELCPKSKADNTRKKYGYAFTKFRKWCLLYNISFIPATELHVSLYLKSLGDNCNTTAIIDEAFYAISWAHKMAGFPYPCASDLTISVRESCHRTTGNKAVNKKEQITSNLLKQLCSLYGSESSSLLNVRTCCMCLLGYAGFLRFKIFGTCSTEEIAAQLRLQERGGA